MPGKIHVRELPVFSRWLLDLRDLGGRNIIRRRIARVASGNEGDVRSLGGALFEFRIAYGPGYRLYFTRRGESVILLLCGGDKDA